MSQRWFHMTYDDSPREDVIDLNAVRIYQIERSADGVIKSMILHLGSEMKLAITDAAGMEKLVRLLEIGCDDED